MRMKSVGAAVLTCALLGCGVVEGNGVIVEQQRSMPAFSGISVGQGFHASVLVGPETSVKIRGDENLLEHIDMEVGDQGVLTVDADFMRGFSPTQPILITVVTPTLHRVEASGGSRVIASGLQNEDFTVEASGGSHVSPVGFSRRLDVEASGGSQVHALELMTESATLKASGGSEARVRVTQRITADASGGSTIVIHGNPPQRDTHASIGSRILFEE